MNTRIFLLSLLLLLLVSTVSSVEVTPKKLVILEFDYFKCKDSNKEDKDIFQDIYFNQTSAKAFYDELNFRIDSQNFIPIERYNSASNPNSQGKIRYRAMNKGIIYHFTTDGFWWTIYATIDLKNDFSKDIISIIEESKDNIKEFKQLNSWIRERILYRNESHPQNNCHMSSSFQEDEVLFSCHQP